LVADLAAVLVEGVLAVDLRGAVDLRRADEEREVILFETCVQSLRLRAVECERDGNV